MKILKAMCAAAVALSLVGCAQTSNSDKELTKVTLMLDYTPNTNHTGFYVAKNKGYYKEAGLDVDIIEPGDNATTSMVAAGKADFGVSYQEDVTYALTSEDPLPIKTIATIIQHNTSGFVSLKSANINSVMDFEGKTYAGWQSPSEEAVLKAVMEKDGGDFSKLTMVGSNGEGPESLGKSSDIQWYFEGWDMIKAKEAGIELNYIPLKELDERLDYYTPVIITNDQLIKSDPELVQSFMDATKKGYQEAIKDPNDSAKLLQKYAKENDRTFLEESQAFLSKNYTDDPENWGLMEEKVWRNYTAFMQENGLIKQDVPSQELFTNQFIK